jgi:steroid delta-isomerase-like uncharacterized protein
MVRRRGSGKGTPSRRLQAPPIRGSVAGDTTRPTCKAEGGGAMDAKTKNKTKNKTEPLIVARTPEEKANIELSLEHFAAESAHDTERTLKTLADDVLYRVVAAGDAVYGKAAVSKYYDVWWTAFPDVDIQILRMVASGEWVYAENFVTATHLGPWLGLQPTGKTVIQHLCAVIRCRGGLMTEETVYYDQLERLRQLGADFSMDGKPLNVPKWKD